MIKPVTVNLEIPSHYQEPDNRLYRFKRKLTFRKIIQEIRKSVKSGDPFSLLEIGCGAGYFISFLEEAFPGASLTGIEYDPRLIPGIRAKVKAATIINGNAEEFELGDALFDVIVSLQVIEHLHQPESMLQRVNKHLKPDGVFILTTPNLTGMGAKVMKDKWHGFRDDHVSLHGFNDWIHILESNGFQPVYCGSTFFSGIPLMNKLPLGLFNWMLLFLFGTLKWQHGESFLGVFKKQPAMHKQVSP
jgi:SAM-dependent methyltransferase